ncbi:MAG: molybdenum cofactor guanylyltransferase [Dehalococcoidia bacterium]
MMPLDGVVLAGGSSRRLGQDKALLQFGDAPLLKIVVDRTTQVCDHVVVAVDRPERYQELRLSAKLVADAAPGLGPISGLQTGLQACDAEHILVVACDLPFLNVELLRFMADLPRSYQALVPWSADRWQPLCAIYARSCLKVVDAIVSEGGGSMHQLLERLDVQRLDEKEMRRLDRDGLSFVNLNERSDLDKARAIWKTLPQRDAARE